MLKVQTGRSKAGTALAANPVLLNAGLLLMSIHVKPEGDMSFGKTAAGGDDLHFHSVGGASVTIRDKPSDGVKILIGLRRELKWRIHPCGFSRSARRCLNI